LKLDLVVRLVSGDGVAKVRHFQGTFDDRQPRLQVETVDTDRGVAAQQQQQEGQWRRHPTGRVAIAMGETVEQQTGETVDTTRHGIGQRRPDHDGSGPQVRETVIVVGSRAQNWTASERPATSVAMTTTRRQPSAANHKRLSGHLTRRRRRIHEVET